MPCCGSVGGCGARAVSRKTPIYFIYLSLTFSDLRKKMEEIAEQEKELARIEAMENALDVTKQDNMGGFYR